MRDLVEGVLEDEREQEVSRRQAKRVFHARACRRSTNSCGAGVATGGVLPSYAYSELDRTVVSYFGQLHASNLLCCEGSAG